MTLLSRKADYALLILSHLHRHPEGANARAVAERYGLSRPFAANILKELCHKGFVTSHRGVKGGYVLQKSAAQVKLDELLEAIGEGFRLTLCTHPAGEPDSCTVEHVCLIKSPLAEIHRRIIDVLRGVTLGDLFEPGTTPTPPAALTLLPLLPICRQPEPTTV